MDPFGPGRPMVVIGDRLQNAQHQNSRFGLMSLRPPCIDDVPESRKAIERPATGIHFGGATSMRQFQCRLAAVCVTTMAVLATSGLGAAEEVAAKGSRLAFRILADEKHDREAVKKARAADTLEHPPTGYGWVWLGTSVTGGDPKVQDQQVTVAGMKWKENEFAGGTVQLSGINLGGTELKRDFDIVTNTSDMLHLRQSPALYLKSVASYRLDMTPSQISTGPNSGHLIHEVKGPTGQVTRSILVKLDEQNVTEKDLARVYRTSDERLQPAIAFSFTRDGGRRFGALTGAHLPKDDGAVQVSVGNHSGWTPLVSPRNQQRDPRSRNHRARARSSSCGSGAHHQDPPEPWEVTAQHIELLSAS